MFTMTGDMEDVQMNCPFYMVSIFVLHVWRNFWVFFIEVFVDIVFKICVLLRCFV